GQRRADIDHHAAVVPAPQRHRRVGSKAVAGALAHVVHGAGGIADAGDQAVRTAQHFHLLVEGGVERTHQSAAEGNADAIDMEAGDVEAARIERRAVSLGGVDVHASSHVEHATDVHETEVRQGLRVEDGQGLRRIKGVEVKPRGSPAFARLAQGLDDDFLNSVGRGGKCRGRDEGCKGKDEATTGGDLGAGGVLFHLDSGLVSGSNAVRAQSLNKPGSDVNENDYYSPYWLQKALAAVARAWATCGGSRLESG